MHPASRSPHDRVDPNDNSEAERRAALTEEAAEQAFGELLAAWTARVHPDLPGARPAHSCSILRPGREHIEFRELDDSGQICAARAFGGGPAGFGSPDEVVAISAELDATDPWGVAVVAAVASERHWRRRCRRSFIEVSSGSGRLVHVTASVNRASIERWGLDWTRMGAAAGIAGSPDPELPAVFLDDDESFFVQMARTPVDVWTVDVTGLWLENGPDGWYIHNAPIGPERLCLETRDIPVRGR